MNFIPKSSLFARSLTLRLTMLFDISVYKLEAINKHGKIIVLNIVHFLLVIWWNQ